MQRFEPAKIIDILGCDLKDIFINSPGRVHNALPLEGTAAGASVESCAPVSFSSSRFLKMR
jgi:hypothetical protein